MKSYEQMARDALRRIEEHEAEKRARRRAVTRATVPVFSFVLTAILGFGIWRSGILGEKRVPVAAPEDQIPMTQEGGENIVPEISGPAEDISNGRMDPEEHNAEDPEPGVVGGPFLGPGDEPVTAAPSVIIDDYTDAPAACYVLPKAGEVGISMPLQRAMEEYGDEGAQFRVVIDVFYGTEYINDKDLLLEESNRLYQLGYTAGVETVTYGYAAFEASYLFIIADKEQIENFEPRQDLGYFLFLYNEYLRASELINY